MNRAICQFFDQLNIKESIFIKVGHRVQLEIQWGSEIRTNLDFEWFKRDWVANGPDLEEDLKSISPTI